MNARQLRIGNYILDTDAPERKNCMVLRLNGGIEYPITYTYDDSAFEASPIKGKSIHGIKITDHWLRCFGFVKHDDAIYHHKKANLVYDIEEQDIFITGKYFDSQHGDTEDAFPLHAEIIEVHQLQNIFQALTGSELTFKNVKP